MTYSKLIQKLFNINFFSGMKLELENIRNLQELLGFPDRNFQSIHIAGTNGKGSVSTKIAKAFEHAGYRVGLYTSPHLSNFRERIRINGNMISEEDVESILSNLFELAEANDIPATFFEFTTMLAFQYFAKEKVNVAVIETGLGGRLDATNIVYPCLTAITSISLDHVEILGQTCDEIAKEKGGIIKEGIPVVIGPNVPFGIIKTIADQKNSPCIQVQCSDPMYEEENRQIAKTALSLLSKHFLLNETSIEEGLKGSQPCRFEIVNQEIPIILDVAHNPDGLQHLFQMVKRHFPKQAIRILFGISKNKDLKGCLNLIANQASFFHLVEASNGRGVTVEQLRNNLIVMDVPSDRLYSHMNLGEGVNQAKALAELNGEILLICGTFFIMREARQALGIIESFDRNDLNERTQ